MLSKETITARMLAHRRLDLTTGCWLWTGAYKTSGLGKLRLTSKWECRVPRLAGYVWNDFPLTGGYVCHKPGCRQSCWNPEHLLYFANSQEGRLYLIKRKRQATPQTAVAVKAKRLSTAMVLEIIRLIDGGLHNKHDLRRRIALRFGGAVDEVAMERILVEHAGS